MSAALKSISRNISTNTNKAIILDDVKNEFANEISGSTGADYSYKREDGIYAVSIETLKG